MSYIALITGASSGIGEATARRLEQLAAELAPTPVTVIDADLTDPEAPARIRDVVEREHGGELHMLVNNAGAAWRGTFVETGWANVERHMKLNFEAPLRLTEALLPLLRATAARSPADAERRVCIVNVSSTAGRVSRPGSGAYSASKFALAGWTDSLHAEERAHGGIAASAAPAPAPSLSYGAVTIENGNLRRVADAIVFRVRDGKRDNQHVDGVVETLG